MSNDMTASAPPKPPPELDAIVDRVLAYRPKDAKPATDEPKRQNRTVYFSRRKRPPADD